MTDTPNEPPASIRTTAEVNAYSDGSRDAIESVLEVIIEDQRVVWHRDDLETELRACLGIVEDGRRRMLQRVTDRPGEPINQATAALTREVTDVAMGAYDEGGKNALEAVAKVFEPGGAMHGIDVPAAVVAELLRDAMKTISTSRKAHR